MAKTKTARVAELEKALGTVLRLLSHEADGLSLCNHRNVAEFLDCHSATVSRLRALYRKGIVALIGPAGRKLPRPPR